MRVHDLLLDAARLEQLQAALANAGEQDPLQRCIDEAESLIRYYTGGYEMPDEVRAGWTRSLALAKAYALVGKVPEDIASAAQRVMDELAAFARGERPGLQQTSQQQSGGGTGTWGSRPALTWPGG